MSNRLLAICLTMLAGALAIYVAVRLIESVAQSLVIIVAALGVLAITGFLVRLLWSRHGMDRW